MYTFSIFSWIPYILFEGAQKQLLVYSVLYSSAFGLEINCEKSLSNYIPIQFVTMGLFLKMNYLNSMCLWS